MLDSYHQKRSAAAAGGGQPSTRRDTRPDTDTDTGASSTRHTPHTQHVRLSVCHDTYY